jgi:spermidine/putrescine transport system ATP-binding protein
VPSVDVRLVDVVKQYGEAVVVDHIDLEVHAGEFFTLLGPSGCGKTTTLRMIGGFEAPTSGLIELKGEDVTWLPPYKRHVNTVFQNYALFPHLTIYENVAFGLRRTKVSDADIRTRVTDMLKLVELPGYERRKPTQLSGGQAQRVALARALINRPSVLLLDEPLGALDLKLRKQMQIELKRIQQEVGITFIFVTHDQEEAMTMSDRIAVMNKGRYEQLGDPASLYERPRTRFVSGFLGVSNLLSTTAEGTDGDFAVSHLADGTPIRVPAALTEGLTTYQIGVRPEKIRLLEPTDPIPDDVNQLQGTIRDVSYLGVSTSYTIETRGGGTIAVYEQNVQRATRSELWEPGEEVRAVFSPTHTFAVEAGGEPPPDQPVGATVAAGAVPPPPPGTSRRKFLVGGAIAVAAVGLGAFLASTSGSGTPAPSGTAAAGASEPPPTDGSSTPPETTQDPGATAAPETGTLRFANWIGYIDIDEEDNSYPTLEKFTAETGIDVQYLEVIDSNEGFFSSSLSGPLGAGLPTDWDLIVMTDWMIGRLVRLGWLETLDRDAMPNFVANLLPLYLGRSFDPDTNLAAPWQSGMTGLMFDQVKTGPLDSLESLFSNAFEGRKTYLDEMRDTVGLSALRLGFDPSALTQEQFDASLAEVDTAVQSGWVRQVTGNSYTESLVSGDAILSLAWSGDIALVKPGSKKRGQEFAWVLANEGGMLWTDNMAVPKGSPSKRLAEIWINFYYDPVNAATIEAWVNYVCPVAGAREVMLETDPELANNPLIFPPEDYVARLHQFRATNAEEDVAWSEAFSKVLGL